MINYFIKQSSSFLIAIVALINYANAQVNTNSNIQPKLIKTQGSGQSDNIHCGLQDKAGNLWFGTTGEGVYRYDGKLFTHFTIKDRLSSNTIWSILEDKAGNIWFGTNNGVCRYNGKSITSIPFTFTNSNSFNITNPINNNPSSKNEVFSILQDKSGKIWFGTSNGVYCYNGKTFERFLDNPGIINKSGLTLKSVQCMLEDKNGNLWFGSGPMAFEGIILYDGKSITNFKPKNESWIRNILEDKSGRLLFATRHIGVISYDGKIFSDFTKPLGLKNDLLNNILVDAKGNIWYASDYVNDNDFTTGGIWKFDGKSNVEFTKKDGLSNTAVFCIIEDRIGNIWFGSRNTGLYRYNGKSFISYTE